MKKTNISVIIPTLGNPARVRTCINLILNNNGLNRLFKLEIVIIDNSSNNGVKRAISSLLGDWDINLIRPKKNLGIAESRNVGIRKAKYDLIIAIDSDIEVLPNTILSIINTFKRNKTFANFFAHPSHGTKKSLLVQILHEDGKLLWIYHILMGNHFSRILYLDPHPPPAC